MRGFSSLTQAQRFLTLHGLTQNVFRLGHHLLQAVNYRFLRTQGVSGWEGSHMHTRGEGLARRIRRLSYATH